MGSFGFLIPLIDNIIHQLSVNRRILLSLGELHVAIVSSTLIDLLGLMVEVQLRITGLHLALVEHRLVGGGLEVRFRVEEFDLKEVLTVVDEVRYEVDHQLLQSHTLVYFKHLVEAGNE
jgi:hypothetical protein